MGVPNLNTSGSNSTTSHNHGGNFYAGPLGQDNVWYAQNTQRKPRHEALRLELKAGRFKDQQIGSVGLQCLPLNLVT